MTLRRVLEAVLAELRERDEEVLSQDLATDTAIATRCVA